MVRYRRLYVTHSARALAGPSFYTSIVSHPIYDTLLQRFGHIIIQGSEVKVRSLYTGFLFLSFWRTFGIFFYYVSASIVIVYASIFSPNLYTCKG